MTPRLTFLAAVVRAFCDDATARDAFIEANRAVLSGLEPVEKRALWEIMKGIEG